MWLLYHKFDSLFWFYKYFPGQLASFTQVLNHATINTHQLKGINKMPPINNETKLLALDLDGTLLNGPDVSEFTLEVIEKCRAQGHFIVVATGRNKQFAQRIVDMVKPHGVSLSDGSCTYVAGQMVSNITIPQADCLKIVEMLTEHANISGVGMNSNIGYLQTVPFPEGMGIAQDLINATTVVPLLELVNYPAYDFWLEGRFANICEDIAKNFPSLHVVNYDGYSIIRPKVADKWHGVETVAKALGVDAANIIAFGDNVNDVMTLTNSGIGVAMGNGTPEAKTAANYVCGSNKEDGVANWLVENLL